MEIDPNFQNWKNCQNQAKNSQIQFPSKVPIIAQIAVIEELNFGCSGRFLLDSNDFPTFQNWGQFSSRIPMNADVQKMDLKLVNFHENGEEGIWVISKFV